MSLVGMYHRGIILSHIQNNTGPSTRLKAPTGDLLVKEASGSREIPTTARLEVHDEAQRSHDALTGKQINP